MTTKKQSATYIDGFVLTVPKKNERAYKKMAAEAAVAWKKFGALDYKECRGDDLKTKGMGGMPAPLSFTALAGAKEDERVWFSFITFKDKKHRKEVNKKVMAYFSELYKDKTGEPMPFDVARMAYGGFTVQVD